MGTELMRICVKEESDEFPSVPPGFESYSSFNVKQVKDSEKQENKREVVVALASQSLPVKTGADRTDSKKITRPLRRRAGVKYNQHGCSEDELDIEKNLSASLSLPKGVVRGCPDCNTCQKVSARWHPEDARRPELDDAPVFHPTEEEFDDPLKYIASIRPKAEQYGICRIVPPSSWRPPCQLKEKSLWEHSKFVTRVQKVNKLQNRNSMSKMFKIHNQTRRKKRKCMKTGLNYSGVNENNICLADSRFYECERFGFEPGPEFTLDSFQKYADEFKTIYFSKNKNNDEMESNTTALSFPFMPSTEDIEGEYWRIVEKPTEEIEVLYGADLETGSFGSGFPKTASQTCSASDEQYVQSGWNLNNFPKLPGSVLCFESGDISGVLVPWLYIGMCFSSFCWHVEDHYLYSLNYMHFGAPKIWYGVPGSDAVKLEEAMKKHLPDLFEEQPDLLHKLVTQLSPSILKSEGVPVYRCIQSAGEFVLTFPRAYHAGFNCGFNCAEAVNVAPVDWLPHGLEAVEQYRGQGRKTSVSHDKLLLGAAREAVRAHWELNLLKRNTVDNLRWKDVCGGDGILAKAFKTRVEMERVSRQFLCHSSPAVKMETDFDATTERECIICLFDLHLSAAGCRCSPDKYACLNHAKQLCSCSPGSRFFLFRYDIGELNILVEALEGKLSAIYRWARMDLGLALSSYVSKDNSQINEPASKIILSSKDDVMKGLDAESPIAYMKLLLEKNLSSRNLKSSSTSISSDEKVISSSQIKKEEGCDLDSDTMYLGSQLRELQSLASDCTAKQPEDTKPSVSVKNEVILLSDDEGEELEKPAPDMPKEACHEMKADPFKSPSGDDKPSGCRACKDMVSTPSVSNSPCASQPGTNLFPNGVKSCCLSDISLYHEQNEGGGLHSHSQSIPSAVSSTCSEFRNTQDSSALKETYNDVMENSITANSGSPLQQSPLHSNEKPIYEDKTEICGTNVASTVVNNVGSVSESSSFTQSNLDKYYRQKGPRIAKVVRRINCNVEPLEYGIVLPGKLWSNSKAIFPKGFRSRVRYNSVLEPANMLYYVSEILDGGEVGPLFMASLEHCPSEVFIHVSPTKCWDMVRERVNMEITKQHRVGRMNLPPLQPPGSLDGYEMFGFSSPAVVQAIEAMDHDRVCSDYWDSRPYSRPQIRILRHPQHKESTGNCLKADTAKNVSETPVEVDTALRGLFKKADLEELRTLYSILSDARSMVDRNLLTRLLNEEIHGRPR